MKEREKLCLSVSLLYVQRTKKNEKKRIQTQFFFE